jgi:hypothetical protein
MSWRTKIYAKQPHPECRLNFEICGHFAVAKQHQQNICHHVIGATRHLSFWMGMM